MTIRVVCKGCNSKIDAADKLLGQTRRCPKCGTPILIEPAPARTSIIVNDAPPLGSSALQTSNEEGAGLKRLRLTPDNVYVVLGDNRQIAYWKGGEGWFVNVGNGYESVKRAPEKLPETGVFVLVEGYVAQTDAGRRLRALRFKKLSGASALKVLLHTEEADVLEKAKEPTVLTTVQKQLFLKHIRSKYFIEFTEGSNEVMEYLTGYDASLRVVGDFKE